MESSSRKLRSPISNLVLVFGTLMLMLLIVNLVPVLSLRRLDSENNGVVFSLCKLGEFEVRFN